MKTYGCGDVSTGDSLRGSVEVVERGRLADLGKDLGTDAECYKEKKKETCFSKIIFFFFFSRRQQDLPGKPPSTVIKCLVFFTLSMIVSMSNGLILLRLMTSTLIPSSFSNNSAASREWVTILLWATMVMSEPAFSTLALPMGMRKSSESSSLVMGNWTP